MLFQLTSGQVCSSRGLALLAQVQQGMKEAMNKGAEGSHSNSDGENSALRGHSSSLADPEGMKDVTWLSVIASEVAPEFQPVKKVCSIR
jgi:hypothetical protein